MDTQDRSTNQNSFLPETQHPLFDERRRRVPVFALADIPLAEYLHACVLQARHLDAQRSPSVRHWQTTAWDFGRFAKAHPALTSLSSGAALEIVRRTLGVGFWQPSLGMDAGDAEMAFDSIWNECWSIPGYDPLTLALEKARACCAAPNSQHDPQQPHGYELFLHMIRFLQEDAGSTPILIPCHKLAALLDCLPMTVSRYRTKALRDGYLQLIKKHCFRPHGQGEATEFRYCPNRALPGRAGSP